MSDICKRDGRGLDGWKGGRVEGWKDGRRWDSYKEQ